MSLPGEEVIETLSSVLTVIRVPDSEDYRSQLEKLEVSLKKCVDLPATNQLDETAEWFAKRFYTIFEQTTIQPYLMALEFTPESAFKKLYTSTVSHIGLLRRCGEVLRCGEDLVCQFLLSTRCALLQPDIVIYGNCGDECVHRDRLLSWLATFGRTLLTQIEEEGGTTNSAGWVVSAIHQLALSSTRELHLLWRHLLAQVIREKAQSVSEDLAESQVQDLLSWKRKVVDPFCSLVLGTPGSNLSGHTGTREGRAELEEWSQQTEAELFDVCGTRLIASFFNLIVEYPDSLPALQDLRLCLSYQSSSAGGNDKRLHNLFISTAKRTLATKLHHAGARTEDILTVLVATIRCICSLYRKNEQGPVVLDVISATLSVLERRKDSVPALVQEITSRSGEVDVSLQDGGNGEDENSDDDEAEKAAGSGLPQTNVISVLLSTMSLNDIVKEYKNTLAEAIIHRSDFDCTAETEVLERMKRFFGEDSLTSCDVMLRDIQSSRRIGQWVKNQGGVALPSEVAQTTTSTIISYTCWPELDDGGKEMKFEVHPSLDAVMEQLQKGFKKMKPNQKLQWLNHMGTIKMSVTQESAKEGPQPKSYDLTVFQASVLLHLKDAAGSSSSSLSCQQLAELMKISKVSTIKPRISSLIPALFVFDNASAAGGGEGAATITIQKKELGSNMMAFEEGGEESDVPTGMSSKELEMFTNMVLAMVKTGGKKSVTQIENSMKMFGKFSGTTQDVVSFLTYLVNQKKLSTDGSTYSKAAA